MPRQQLKKTSYFYKKKLSNQTQLIIKSNQINIQSGVKVLKNPKQAKLRAKQARERKKNYIAYLQKKVDKLTKELHKQRQKQKQSTPTITHNNVNISLVVNKSNSAFTKTSKTTQESQMIDLQTREKIQLKGIQNEFHKLYQAVREMNEEQTCVNLANLRKNFGVAGVDRQNWIKSLFSRVIELIMPMHCRLLLEYCQNSEQFYKLLGGSDSLKQFRRIFFDNKCKSMILESRPLMVQIKQQYEKILLKISQCEIQIHCMALKIQSLIDKIQQSMNCLFVGRILVNLDIQRQQESLGEIFPVNYYQKCKNNQIQNLNHINKNDMIEFQSMLDQGDCYQNDFFVFDSLFRVN